MLIDGDSFLIWGAGRTGEGKKEGVCVVPWAMSRRIRPPFFYSTLLFLIHKTKCGGADPTLVLLSLPRVMASALWISREFSGRGTGLFGLEYIRADQLPEFGARTWLTHWGCPFSSSLFSSVCSTQQIRTGTRTYAC